MNNSGFPQNPYMGVPPQVPPTAAVPYGPSAQKPNTIYIVFYWLRFIVHAAHIGFWIFIVTTLRSGSTDYEQGLGMVIGIMLLILGTPYILYQRGKLFGLAMGINIYGAVLAGIAVFFLLFWGIEGGEVELISGGLMSLLGMTVCILYSVDCARHMQDIKRQREYQRLAMQQAAAAYPAYGGGMVPQYTQVGYEQQPPHYYQ